MKTNRKAAILALGLALLPSLAGAIQVTNEWWTVDFESPTRPAGLNQAGAQCGGVTLHEGDSVAVLTNTTVDQVNNIRPAYASGFWYMEEGDDSVITNGVVTNALAGTSETSLHLKLDTQGSDLRWAPSNGITAGIVNVVDADLLLVGSDSPPDPKEFDTNANLRVQAAIYLKNELNADQETTNSILCVYANNINTLSNEWRELVGDVVIEDNSWHHIQVSIDYRPDLPTVLVWVDGKPMSPRSGESSIVAATPDKAKLANQVREICFRGTGELDNFVGTTSYSERLECDFAVQVFIDGVLQPFDEAGNLGNLSRIQHGFAGDPGDGLTLEFPFAGFKLSDGTYSPDYYSISAIADATYAIEKIRLTNFVDHTETTIPFELSQYGDGCYNPLVVTDKLYIPYIDGWVQEGPFDLLNLVTDGATDPTNVIARVYFKTIGAYDANAVKVVGENVSTNSTIIKPATFKDGGTTNLVWTFNATDGANVLHGIRVENGATATYTPGANAGDGVVTVSVTLTAALSADTTFVTATYAAGSYTDAPSWIDNGDGTYVLGNYAAKIGTTYYGTLQEAFDAVPDSLATTTTVTLLADIDLTGANANVTNDAGKCVVLDLNGNSIAGNVDGDLLVLGTLILTDSVEDSEGKIYAVAPTGSRGLVRVEGGTFTMVGGAIESIPDPQDPGENGSYAVVYRANSTVNIEGGTITAGWFCVSGNGNDKTGSESAVTITGGTLLSTADYAVYFPNAGTLTITDGARISGAAGALTAQNGTINITGGEFLSSGTGDIQEGTDGTSGLGDVAVNIVGKYGATTATISGGTFIAQQNAIVLSAGSNGATIAVSGGSFSQIVPLEYCAEGFVPVTTQDENGRYTVKTGAIQVAGLDPTPTYGSFADALAVHGWAATYVLLTNVEETVTITNKDDTFSVDLGEFADGLVVDTSVPDGVVSSNTTAGVTVWSVAVTPRYTITFNNDDGTEYHVTNNVLAGSEGYGPATDPTKAATAQYTYAFAGWSNEVSGVVYETAALPPAAGNETYRATYSATVNEYTITWKMDDDSVIDTTEVAYGTVPKHAAPTKPSTAQYAYTFTGWDPEPVAVEEDAAYKATFEPVLRSYDVTFWTNAVDVGTAYHSTNAPYGTHAAAYAPTNDPTRAATSTTNFTFAGWTNAVAGGAAVATADLPDVTTNAAWAAVWTETPIWKVTFKNGADTIYETNYLDGATAEYVGEPPTKAATAQYAFTFAGWDPALGAVTADTVYAATFSSNLVTYTITFSTNGAVYVTTDAAYGATDYGPADPARDGFTFDGWTNAVSGAFVAQGTAVFPAVGGAAEWTAVWTEDLVVEAIDPGNAMDANEKALYPPVAVTSAGFTVHFKGVKGVTYSLLAADSLTVTQADWENPNGTDVEVVQSVSITTDAQASDVQTLVAPMTDSVKFFKIGARKTGN